MKNIALTNLVDKSGWTRGEWDGEADKEQWTDEKTGLPCLFVRNHSGFLCGYVGINSSHPFFEQHHGNCDVSVHGGLTFSDKCMPHEMNEPKVCHSVEDGEDDNVWWLGFDCAHGGDFCPAYHSTESRAHFKYRTVEYVKNECADLAQQLAAIT
jgi:hypothetical protein